MQKVAIDQIQFFNTFRLQSKFADTTLISDHNELVEFLTNKTLHDRMNIVIVGELSNTVLGESINRPLLLFRNGTFLNLHRSASKASVTVSGSYRFDSLVKFLCDNEIPGMELLSGIPGTVGGAIAQNVAAYGQQISSKLKYIRAFDLKNNSVVELSSSFLNFSYRSSILKSVHSYSPAYVILEAVFDFPLNQELDSFTYYELSETHILQGRSLADLFDRRATVLEVRSRKGMVVDGNNWLPCAGSFFLSPIVDNEAAMRLAREVRGSDFAESFFSWYKPDITHTRLPAAIVMRAAGFLNGDQWGSVGLSPHHILSLCALEKNASATEICALSRFIQSRIFEQFNISLNTEVRFLGNINIIEINEFIKTRKFIPGKEEPSWAKRIGVPG